jgi:predicted metalloendopeptidase
MNALERYSSRAAIVLVAMLTAGCTGGKVPQVATTAAPAFDRASLDTTCEACTDFYQFANGGWLNRTKIPAAYASYGAFDEVYDRNNDVLHSILDSAAAGVRRGTIAAGSDRWKVGTFYASCMDTAAIDRLGAAPIKPLLDSIGSIASSAELPAALGSLERAFGLAPFSNGAEQDPKDASTMIAGVGQGGLSLPERDYYFRSDSKSKEIRDRFVTHVAAMLRLAGDSPDSATAEARNVLAFETQMAKASRPPAALRDPIANYHKMSLADAQRITPHFTWTSYFQAQGAPTIPAVDIGQPEYLAAFDTMLVRVPLADWKSYLRWRALHNAAPSLSDPFVKEHFKYDQLFSGATELLPRWKRCSQATDNALGELLGQEYVARTFTPEAKARAVKIVSNLVDELHSRIDKLDWMSPATKAQAESKLGAFTRKIGYPDRWRDYSALEVKDGSYLANVRAARHFETARNWAKIGKPVDRMEWQMTPPTVNAYYNPARNEIVFPAGILQPPFYNPNADDAINYGAMGAVIGHEMTHGFDDQGRQFDKEGNLNDWWAKEDASKYLAEAGKVERQFNGYTVLDTATHVNGKLTLGENIADFGGLTVAYAAMQRAIGAGPHPKIDGFTPEQRFFLGWAQVWRELERPELTRMLVNANEHSPSKWRVNGPLSNMPEFRAAWGCKDGDPMVRPAAEQPRIW